MTAGASLLLVQRNALLLWLSPEEGSRIILESLSRLILLLS